MWKSEIFYWKSSPQKKLFETKKLIVDFAFNYIKVRRVEAPPAPDSTPKKIGNLLNWNNSEHQRLEEELMTTRLREMDALTELKELRLKVRSLHEVQKICFGFFLWITKNQRRNSAFLLGSLVYQTKF